MIIKIPKKHIVFETNSKNNHRSDDKKYFISDPKDWEKHSNKILDSIFGSPLSKVRRSDNAIDVINSRGSHVGELLPNDRVFLVYEEIWYQISSEFGYNYSETQNTISKWMLPKLGEYNYTPHLAISDEELDWVSD